MTFSIVAIDIKTGEVGTAVASKFLAVGGIVPWTEAGCGAVATQALCNATFGRDGLAQLANGRAPDVLAALLTLDARPERRQVGMVDAMGNAASHTGSGCQPWAGHRVGNGCAFQGNCLVGPQVITKMAEAFEQSTGPLHLRLLAALSAGDRAGGDRRGRQSAAVKVMGKGAGYQGLSDTVLDLRVDDHPKPMKELERLFKLHDLYFPVGTQERLPLKGSILAEMKAIMRRADHAVPDGEGWTHALRTAVDAFIGGENLEERIDLAAATIDRIALDHLRLLHPPAVDQGEP